MPLGQRINCRSSKNIFNQEVQQQWQQNRHDTSAEEFAQSWNFLWTLQGPDTTRASYPNHGYLTNVHQSLADEEDSTEVETDDENEEFGKIQLKIPKRKQISLCRHKLQGRAYTRHRKIKTAAEQPKRLPEREEEDELDHEWLQLIQMEKIIEKRKHELLNSGSKVCGDPDDDHEALWETERGPIKEEDESLDDEDLAYINDILNSFSKPKFNSENPRDPKLPLLTPEGALTRVPALMKTPPKFNQNFNQNLTSYSSEEEDFSYLSNFEEEGSTELADYFSDEEEDDSLNEEDLFIESDTWSHIDFNKFEEFSNKKQKPSDSDTAIFRLETINETNFEDQSETSDLNSISSLSGATIFAFSAWQPFIPPEHAFQNFVVQSWPSDFSSQASSLQEPTLIQISTIATTTKLTPATMEPVSPILFN
jgi:hypothetical protein